MALIDSKLELYHITELGWGPICGLKTRLVPK